MSAAMPSDGHDDTYMTTDEVAARLRITRKTAERKARAGSLPAVRVGRRWLFPRRKIERIARMLDWDQQAARWDDEGTAWP